MMESIICQSCGILMDDENLFGINADNSNSKDYCHYCLANSVFCKDESMEEMIESCIPFRINEYPNAEIARAKMMEYFPNLKRWRK